MMIIIYAGLMQRTEGDGQHQTYFYRTGGADTTVEAPTFSGLAAKLRDFSNNMILRAHIGSEIPALEKIGVYCCGICSGRINAIQKIVGVHNSRIDLLRPSSN